MQTLKNFSLVLLLSFFLHSNLVAQCSAIVNSFPYFQNFEGTDNGNWVSLPSGSWDCGTPSTSKPVIRSAGGGLKSWIVGGLSGSSYSNGNSELRSPCFDFSSLNNPEISFKLFWETEKRFDGATFQYSIDGANSWTTLGSENSNSTCSGVNWFTYSPIVYLGNEPGWSGNIQSNGGGAGNCLYGLGSGTWVTAKHNMSMLAGATNVIFRFSFGAGTQCNDFDGFAVDDVRVGETPPPNIADFSYYCDADNTVRFINNSASCSVSWDFGDPASGMNTSTQENPSHIFSVPGQQYNVILTAYFAAGSSVKNKTIYTLNATPLVTGLNKCNGDANTNLTLANPTGDTSGLYTYSWNTLPVQTTPTISNVPAGTYQGTVSSPSGCSSSVNFVVVDPPVLNISVLASPAKCGFNSGSIQSSVSGGVSPYNLAWNTNPVQASAAINDLAPGIYSLTVTDQKGCVKSINNINVIAAVNEVNVLLGNDTTICQGQTLLLNPGVFDSYLWQDSSTTPVFTGTKTGTYSVEVVDSDGCIGAGDIKLTVDCKGIYFPSAFSPNMDALNAAFGPIGDLASLKNFSMVIYDRYGQVVFTTSDAFLKWDGSFRGRGFDSQSFVWIATYTQRGRMKKVEKGLITLIR